jgi:hypothetical protein
MQYIQTKVPKRGIHLKRSKETGEVEVWNVEVTKIASLKRIKINNRHVYQTRDGQVWSKASDAGEHELKLMEGTV